MRRRFIAYHRYQINPKVIIILLIFVFGFLLTYIIKKVPITKENAQRIISLSTSNILNISSLDIKSPQILNINNSSNVKETSITNDSKPLIYIYNTHQSEGYDPGYLKEYNITPTVYMAANILKKKLQNIGLESIVEDENIVNVLKEHNWKYSESYNASMLWLENATKKYPTIKYYIDLHRDSHAGSITINDKPYAKMMFVIGMNHDNYQKNESLMLKLNDYLKDNYPGLMRDVFYGKKSRYNQHFNENVILIEVGGPNNNIEEVQNSVTALADALSSIIGGI